MNSIIKSLGAMAALTAVNAVYAQDCVTCVGSEGFYLGLMGGKATYNEEPTLVPTGTGLFTLADPNNSGFGARLFFGYGLNAYFAFDSGFSYYSPLTYNTETPTVCGTPRRNIYAFDFMAKGMLPLGPIKPFIKGGVAVVHTETQRLSPPTDLKELCGETTSTFNVRPAVGLGVSYNLTPNWVVDLSVNRIMPGSGSKSIDLAAIGISYHFVDLYCGQFLC